VFRTDALENVLVFLAVKAAQGVPTEDIHPKGFAYLAPELFETNRSVGLTFSPRDRCTFPTHHNAVMRLPRRFDCCLNETTRNREKSSRVTHIIDHKCGERFVNIQLNVVLFGGGINIYALGLQSRNKTVRARLGNDNDSRTSGLESYSDEASKGVKKRCFVGIELNLMAEGLALLRCR